MPQSTSLLRYRQAYENVVNLVGLGASPEYLQKLTYLALHHHPSILQIDTVRWVGSQQGAIKQGLNSDRACCIPSKTKVLPIG